MEPETGWRAAKRTGKAAVPAGDATVALLQLLDLLSQKNLFVVPTGEVESFVKTVPGKGPKWVVEVIEGNHIESAVEAKEFVAKVIASLA